MFEYSEGAARDAERSRQRWAGMTRKEKRHGLVFGLVVWAVALAVAYWEANPGIF